MSSIQSKNIVFVTGAFVCNSNWAEWRTYFESKGYKTIAPPWPHKDGSAEDLRKMHPLGNPGLAALTLAQLTDHYANIVKGFPEKPIVIGHSLGGLITQIIVNRGLAAAAVAIHPVPPQGVFP
jgi:pimeloyl-ACP methyl ester carboxylesterase